MREEFLYHDGWLDRRYAELNAPRWPTFKAALNLWLQFGGDTIVETGCVRQADEFGSGCSTLVFAEVVARYGGCLWSVDNDPQHVATAVQLTQAYASNRRCILADSVEFLQHMLLRQSGFSGRVDLLYLDSLDYPMQQLIARFGCADEPALRELVAEISEDEFAAGHADLIDPPQRHCLAELEAALSLLHSKSIVLIDDNRLPGGGKPRLAKRRLAELGWLCVLDAHQTLWMHPESGNQ